MKLADIERSVPPRMLKTQMLIHILHAISSRNHGNFRTGLPSLEKKSRRETEYQLSRSPWTWPRRSLSHAIYRFWFAVSFQKDYKTQMSNLKVSSNTDEAVVEPSPRQTKSLRESNLRGFRKVTCLKLLRIVHLFKNAQNLVRIYISNLQKSATNRRKDNRTKG